MKLSVLRLAMARWMAIAVLVVFGAALPQTASAQHTSLACPPQTATVANGGSIEIDITACDDYNFGYGNGPAQTRNGPSHGQATVRQDFVPPSTAKSVLIYNHNGNAATQDTFEMEDLDLRWIRFTITITPPSSAIVVSPANLPTLTAGTPFSQTLSSTGGTGPYTYSLASGTFPLGLTLNGSGVLSGTPTQRGLYSFSVRSEDSTGAFSVKSYSGSVQNPSLSLATPTVTLAAGVPASAQLATNGGLSPHIYATEPPGAPMPFGLSLSSSGLITGTPVTTGSATVQLRVTDASTPSNAPYFELETLTVTVVELPTVAIAVAPASVAEDGATNLVYTVTRSAASASALTVNLTTSGSATAGTDYSGGVASVTIAANATTATVTIDPAADTSIETNETVTLTVAAGSGYTVGAPASATGTIINDDNAIATIAVSPSTAREDGSTNLDYTVTLSQASASAVSVNFTVGGTASNGTDYGAIASPLVIAAGSTTGTISVNPTTDATNESDETVTISLAAGTGYVVGGASSATGTITNDDGTSTLCSSLNATVAYGGSVSINAGSCHAGFGLGNIATPPTHGTASIGAFGPNQTINYSHNGTSGTTDSFVVRDGNSPPSNLIQVNITITPPTSAIVVSPASLNALAAGTPFSQTLTSTGGVGSYTYSLSTGSLPTGLTLSSGGVLSGTPTQRGTYTFSVRSQDSVGDFSTKGYTGTVANPTLSITPTTATAAQGVAVSQALTASGGVGPYSYQLETGSFPAGITISSAGVISGTTSAAAGDYAVTLRVTDSSSGPGSYFEVEAFTLTVAALPSVSIAVTPASTAEDGATNLVYTVTRSAVSASPLTVNIATSGTAVAGSDYAGGLAAVTIAANATTATVTIDPTVDGAAEADETVILTVASGAGYLIGAPASATGTIVNDDLPLNILPENLPNGTVGILYSATLTTDGGVAPYSYAVTAGTLPAGLNFDPNGTLSGTPVAAGNASFTITATDSSGAPGPYSASRAYTVTIAAPFIELTPVTLPNATFGVPYSETITADGSIAPYSFAVTVGSLPPGLTLAPDGTLSGTPTLGGPRSFTITASDATAAPGPYTGARAYTLTVDVPALVLPATTLPDGATDTAYSAQINSATGGVAPYTYVVTSDELPYGLTMSPSGAITGTPTTANLFGFVVTATDSNSGTGPSVVQQSYSINIVNTPPVVGPVTASVAYGAGLTPIPLSITGTANSVAVVTPPTNGRAIVDRMTISYIPDTGFAGTDSFTYLASNNGANSAPATVTISVANPAITVTAGGPLTATVGAAYNQTFTFTGGTQPFTNYQVTGLPAGMQAGSSGANTIEIIGTPTSAGSFTLTVSATDASTGTGPFGASQTFTLVVAGPTIAMTPGAGTLIAAYNTPFTQAFTASGGVGPFTYVLTGTLPAGLTFTGNSLSGTATAPGSYPVTVTATDTGSTGAGSPFTIAQNYTINVPAPTIMISPESLPNGTVGASYSQTASASGGVAAYNFAVSAGALPPGLTLSAGGVIAGTPTAGGSYNFTLTATDANAQTGSRAYALTIGAAVVTLPPTSLAGGQVGFAYNAQLNPASGGTAPYSYAVSAGALPGGLTLSAGGTLSGTPTVFGTFNFAVTATDSSTGSGPYAATQNYSVQIEQPAPVANPVSVTVAYGSTANPIALNITGGAAASVALATPPTNGTAVASGTGVTYTPNAGFAGSDSFTYTATNAGGTSAPATVTITVASPAITIAAGGPLATTAGTAYSQTFTFSGGAQPFAGYQVTNLPAGLAISGSSANSVTVSGIPTSAGSFALAVSGTDASTGRGPFSTSQTFTLIVNAPVLALTPATGSFTANYAAAYSQAITATGGVGPYSYSLTGNLPAGVTLNPSTGLLSGSPTASGNFSFAVTATDTGSTGAGAPFTVQGNYSLTVAAPLVTVTPTALPLATAGAAYSATLTAAGGVGPYRFVLGGGALPAGLSLAAGGIVSGTPTAAGAFAFTVNVTDANGQAGTASLTLTVGNSAITVTPATLPAGTQGVAYSQRLTAAGGIAPYSFAVSSGALPAGLTINATTGVIAGTPTGSGDATFAITVSDSTGGTPSTATITYTLRIVARPNPANDPEVRGLVQAQVNSARRFVDTQVGNFNRRLEGLRRGGGSGGFSNSLRISASDHCIDTITAWTNPICANAGGNAAGGANRQPGGFGTNSQGGSLSGGLLGGGAIGSAAPVDGTNGAVGAAGAAGSGSAQAPLSIWAGGTIRWGDRDEMTGRPSERFESEGVTFGADYRFSPSFAAGVGVGLGRETTDVGRSGSQSEGEAKTLAIYGSHLLGGGLYVDWLAGYQWLDFDLRRYVTLSGAMVNSSRSGRQWFGSVSAGADIESGDWRFTPYARIDAQRGKLNGYTENSGSVFDLTYLDQDVAFTSIGAGAKIDYRIAVENGFFLPRLRLEYQRDIERDSEALVAYFDQISGPFNAVPLTGYARSRLLMGFGVEMMIGDRTAVDIEYSHRDNSGAGTDQGVLINVKQVF
ncbi:MAG: putative Ig domain-containing protein [Sphingopyxis sp.]|nr:putative Ig domain-containing protein [Sphingopyxis sp.]